MTRYEDKIAALQSSRTQVPPSEALSHERMSRVVFVGALCTGYAIAALCLAYPIYMHLFYFDY